MTDIITTPIVYLVGTFFVIIFAARFFNNPQYEPKDKHIRNMLEQDPEMFPALPKHVTEKTRYHIYVAAFSLFTVVLYYFISLGFPYFIASFTKHNGMEFESSVAFVIGTLLFISLSPKIPYIKPLLTQWKESMHRRAQIPDKAMYVFDCMRFSEINKSSEQFNVSLDRLLNSKIGSEERSDIEKDYFYFDKDRIERKWARLVYLMDAIETWSKDQRFARHLKAGNLKWLTLRSYYIDKLIHIMKQYRQGALTESDIETAKNSIDILLIKIYWMITLLLFMANKAGEDPCSHLKEIGWIITPEKYFRFSSRQIVFTGMAIFISILLSAALSTAILLWISGTGPTQFIITPNMIFHWLTFGIPFFVIPLLVTMLAKRILSMNGIWGVQHPDDPVKPFAQRPWEIYLIVNAASYAVTFIAITTLYFLMPLPANPVSNPINHIALYSGLAFITSAFICYLIDTPAPGWETNWHFYEKNIIPALFHGTLNVLFMTLAFLVLNDAESISSLGPTQTGKLIVYDVIVFTAGIAVYLTSHIATKHYERRENGTTRTTDGWSTISIDAIRKRVKIMKLPGNLMGIIADDELRNMASIGDTVEFYDHDKPTITGNIKEIDDDLIQVSLPI